MECSRINIHNMHVGQLSTSSISARKNYNSSYRLYKTKAYITSRMNFRLYKLSSQSLRYVHSIYGDNCDIFLYNQNSYHTF